MAVVAGWGHLAGVVGFLGLLWWFIAEVVAAANQPGALNKELEDLVGPQFQILIGVGLAGDLLSAALTALLLHFARLRGQSQDENVLMN